MKSFSPKIIFVCTVLFFGFNAEKEGNWKSLFNGKDLSGWDTYLGPSYDSAQSKFDGAPIGLNSDPHHVFTVVNEDGKSAIRISGENFGGISTKEEFENYHLQLQFKWGKLKWHPRKKDKRDSGVLYHAVGPHGVDWNFWMRSQEFQVQEGDCGDYWGVAGGIFDVHASKRNEKDYVFDPAGPLLTFSEKNPQGRHCIKNPDAEKPYGEWNTLDLYCFGQTSVHVVNDVVVMVLYNSRQGDDGQETPLSKGKIQIQSEGAEIYYRNIQIKAIKEIPKGMIK